MARLLIEANDKIEMLVEKNSSGEKQYYIVGPYSSADTENRNGRVYPSSVLVPSVERYVEEYVNNDRAVGELEHPENPEINMDRISHKILDLHFEGKELMGKSLVVDTPCGKIVKALIEADIRLGVSTRALGSLKEQNGKKVVQEKDFEFRTVDVVHQPSNYSSLVEAIYESAEWTRDIDGTWREGFRDKLKSAKKENLQETYISLFQDFVNHLKVK